MNEIDFLQQTPIILFIDSIKTSKDMNQIINQACSNFTLVVVTRHSAEDNNFVEIDRVARRSGLKNLQIVDNSRDKLISFHDRVGQIIRSFNLASSLVRNGIFVSSNMDDAAGLSRHQIMQTYFSFFQKSSFFGQIEGLNSTFTMILDGTNGLSRSNIGELLVVRH